MPETEYEQDVQAAKGGDLASFGRLCHRYYPTLTAVAWSVLHDHHLAEDAAQEALARALVRLGDLKRPERFGFWLGKICRNCAKDLLRKNIRLRNLEESSKAAASNPSKQEPQHEHLRQCLFRLPEKDRELIVMRYYNDLSYEEMSSVSGLSPAAINSKLYRAKKKLAQWLRRDEVLDAVK